jgi:ABC-type Fe3+-citrate transport system substrate-binding protein
MTLVNKKSLLIGFALITLLVNACGGDNAEKNKTMAQLQNEEGIPVKVRVI